MRAQGDGRRAREGAIRNGFEMRRPAAFVAGAERSASLLGPRRQWGPRASGAISAQRARGTRGSSPSEERGVGSRERAREGGGEALAAVLAGLATAAETLAPLAEKLRERAVKAGESASESSG